MPNEPTAHNQQAEAYQRHLPEMKALPASDVLTPTVDVTAMTSLLFGILPNIARYRDTFGKLEGIRAEAFTNLESYAHALNHADGEYLIASDATPEAIAIALAAGEIRNRLSLAAQLLLASRVITYAEMPDLKGGKGYLNLARDITALAALVRTNLEKAKAKGGLLVSEADLDEAVDTASKLLAVVGQREHSVNEVAEATQLRNRAYTLAYHAYDEVRRGISYYRWYERDIDTFLPTIHTLNQRARTSQTGGARPSDPLSGNGNGPRPSPAPLSHEGAEASGEGNEPDGYDKDGPFRQLARSPVRSLVQAAAASPRWRLRRGFRPRKVVPPSLRSPHFLPMPIPALRLGICRPFNGRGHSVPHSLPAHHLVTHGVVVGMTGSGKTGLLTVLTEEAMAAGIPTLAIDVKGDLPNLLLAFPTFSPAAFAPWAESALAPGDERSPEQMAQELARNREEALRKHGIDETVLARLQASTNVRVLTPGSTGGEALHVLSSLERRSSRWDTDAEAARASLSAAVSLVLRLVGRDADPARSKEHVLLAVLAERRLRAGQDADLGSLLADLAEPPIDEIGALPLDTFLSKSDRRALSASLNNLLASPTFASWRTGATLDIGAWLTPTQDITGQWRTPTVIVSVAHLDDEERALVLGVLLEEVLAWVRSLPGTSRLRAMVLFDEVYGYLPPHPANPPTKRPLVSLLKQARAFGVGVVVATQNPMDLDYRALSNAGLWAIGRLQTDADRERVVDGLSGSTSTPGQSARESERALEEALGKMAPRWFLLRNVHAEGAPVFLSPRYAMSYLRGPMTRVELGRALRERAGAPSTVG